MSEATEHAETYNRHGEPDPAEWDEAVAVTDRASDEPSPNTTFAERAKAMQRSENKAVSKSESKAPAKKTTAKKAPAKKGS